MVQVDYSKGRWRVPGMCPCHRVCNACATNLAWCTQAAFACIHTLLGVWQSCVQRTHRAACRFAHRCTTRCHTARLDKPHTCTHDRACMSCDTLSACDQTGTRIPPPCLLFAHTAAHYTHRSVRHTHAHIPAHALSTCLPTLKSRSGEVVSCSWRVVIASPPWIPLGFRTLVGGAWGLER